MKRIFIFLLVMLIVLNILSCTTRNANIESSTSSEEDILSKKEEQEKNSLFTDRFFEDIEIINCNPCGVVTGEQTEPVIEFLKNLTLEETNEHIALEDESGESLDGVFYITFRKSNNYEITYYMDAYGTFTYYSTSALVETFSYTAGANIISNLKAAFNQGREIS